MHFSKEDFGTDFKWGVSTAAYQIEGAHDLDGKGQSIWDNFSQKKRNISNGHNGNIACNFYHQYDSDIALIKQLNIPNYRFSISWSRIIPNGIGEVNSKGIEYYDKVIDTCLALGIEPWVTLYHWDLPEALHKKGGWTNREVLNWFSDYVHCCIKYFGDRVKHWMVLNEPMVFTGAGYFLGVHAPGKVGLSNFLAATHHATMCQAEGGRILRSYNNDFKIGTTFSYSDIAPLRELHEKDARAAVKVDALLNRLFLEPLLGMGYPLKDLKILQKIERFMLAGDEQKLAFEMDFIGLQNYTREKVRYAPLMPFMQAKIVKANKRKVPHTLMNWEVYPSSIYNALKRLQSYPSIKEILVTENGAAFEDHVIDNEVNDTERLHYLQEHIAQVLKAQNEGVNVKGYFVWTLMDNFEWAEGFHPRFGLIHVDFTTQKRIIKSSGKWYSQLLTK